MFRDEYKNAGVAEAHSKGCHAVHCQSGVVVSADSQRELAGLIGTYEMAVSRAIKTGHPVNNYKVHKGQKED